MPCPQCHTENPANARFCLHCGIPLVQTCPNCQSDLVAGTRFCMHCGQRMRASVPADAARHVRLAAAAPAPLVEKVRAAAQLAGERRTITVLFADIVDSTGLIAQVGEETWKTILNGVFDRLTPIIYRYEGTIAQIMGDALVAFFGAPVAHEDDPHRAAYAGLDLLQATHEYAGEIRWKHGIHLAVRICLHTGPVVVGPAGEDLKYKYTTTEGTVNLAARMKFTAQPMTVLVSEHTCRFIAPAFDCEPCMPIAVKGRAAPLHIYQVRRPKAEPEQGRGLAGLTSPMVGRQSELDALLTLSKSVQAGLGRAALIIGEPGLGKTRLLQEWRALVAPAPSTFSQEAAALYWARGYCLSYGTSLPYHLLISLLRSLIGVLPTASEAQTHAALTTFLEALFGERPADVYPYLGHLLSLELDEALVASIPQLNPRALQARYLTAMRKLLTTLAERRPVALILEDLHWADPSSTELLGELLPLSAATPVLFCLVTRPEREAAGWQLAAGAREILGGSLAEITLEALSPAESHQLVTNLLDIQALPAPVRGTILDKAEGNPFFVEEVIRMFIDQGAIYPQDSCWVVDETLIPVDIPDNLQGLLLARIDRLPEAVRATMLVAAVIGRRFGANLLAQVLAQLGETTPLMQHLNTLETAGLIRMTRVEPELEYIHRHILVQEAAYASLLSADQLRLHRVVGETLERLYPHRLEELSPRLGEHFAEAGHTPAALKYLNIAGEAALASFANQEAEGHFRRGLALVEDPAQRAGWLIALGRALSRQSKLEGAVQAWMQGIEIYKALGDLDNLARQYAHVARAASHAGDHPRGLRLCREGLAAAGDEIECHGMAALLHETARALHFNGMSAEAQPLCQRALEMAERLGAVDIQADALATYGLLPHLAPETALDALQKAVELAESAGLLRIASRALHNLGAMTNALRNDHRTAREHFLRAAALHRQRGVTSEELFSLVSATDAALALGELDEVETVLPKLHKLLDSMPESEATAHFLAMLEANVLAQKGEWVKALRILRKVQPQARQSGNLQTLAGIANLLGWVLIELSFWENLDGWEEAENALREALKIHELGLGSPPNVRAQLALLHMQQGNYNGARHLLAAVDEPCAPTASPIAATWSQWAEASLAATENRWGEAFSLFKAVAAQTEQMGMRWFHARMLLDWAEAHTQRGEPAHLERGQELLLAAQRIFEELGAQHYAELAQGRIAASREKTYAQAKVHKSISQELAAAGKIQEGFLPQAPPDLPGWSLSATLLPARETSGDYYDFIPLPEGRLGIVIADVMDKGAGAALYMALSRTLLRTYAGAYPASPKRTLFSANRRILTDTPASLFITLFYGVLDPATGSLTYCNAGHNPPYLLRATEDADPQPLIRTGVPLGLFEDASWEQATTRLAPSDVLALYTDGIPEAQNPDGGFFGNERLLAALQANRTQPAHEIQRAVLNALHAFIGSAPRTDDVTLVVVGRGEA